MALVIHKMLHRPTTSGNEYIHRIINISEYTPADTSMSLFLFIGTARIVCAARSMQRYSVRPSVPAWATAPNSAAKAGPQGYRPSAAPPHSNVAGECR